MIRRRPEEDGQKGDGQDSVILCSDGSRDVLDAQGSSISWVAKLPFLSKSLHLNFKTIRTALLQRIHRNEF